LKGFALCRAKNRKVFGGEYAASPYLCRRPVPLAWAPLAAPFRSQVCILLVFCSLPLVSSALLVGSLLGAKFFLPAPLWFLFLLVSRVLMARPCWGSHLFTVGVVGPLRGPFWFVLLSRGRESGKE